MSRQLLEENVELCSGRSACGDNGLAVQRRAHIKPYPSVLSLSTATATTGPMILCTAKGASLGGKTGSALVPVTSPVDMDGFGALCEQGMLVALSRGLDVDATIGGLRRLFSAVEFEDPYISSSEEESAPSSPPRYCIRKARNSVINAAATPRPALRRFESQPNLTSDHKRRRHFSFEPGDDQLGALDEDVHSSGVTNQDARVLDEDILPLPHRLAVVLPVDATKPNSAIQTLSGDFYKPSKIPSPVHNMGRVRRENSASSLQSTVCRRSHERRNSSSSVLTSFRKKHE